MFIYCNNNPVNRKDPTGLLSFSAKDGAGVGVGSPPTSPNPVVTSAQIGGLDKVIGDFITDRIKTTPYEQYKTMSVTAPLAAVIAGTMLIGAAVTYGSNTVKNNLLTK